MRRIRQVLAVGMVAAAVGMAAGAATPATASGTGTVSSNVYPGPNWYGPDDAHGYQAIERVVVPQRLGPDLFLSTQWWFGNTSALAYEGIQTGRGPGDSRPEGGGTALFSVWGARDAVAGPGARCEPFEEDGLGRHCFAPLAVVVGHRYLTRVTIDHTDGEYQWWHGTVTDLTAGKTVDLGLIETDNNQPATAPVDFMEYFGDRTVISCEQYPYSVADFETPMLTPAVGGAASPATLADPSPPSCGERGTMTETASGMRVEYGGPQPSFIANLAAQLAGGAVNLSWSSPISDGGSPILDTTVETSTDNGATWTTAATAPAGQTSIALTTVDPKTSAVRVAAVNAAGIGAYSPVAALALVSTPQAPSATAGAGVATVRWTVPLSGSGAIIGYLITPYRNSVVQPGRVLNGASTVTTMTGLTNGASYTFTVAAVSTLGTGPQSVATTPVVIGAPAAPTGTHPVRVGAGKFKVNFSAGVQNGAKTTSYTATCRSSNGGMTRTASGARSPIAIIGLTPSKSYTCTVRATNSRGTGPSSPPSAPTNA